MGSETKSRRLGGLVLASVAAAGLVVSCNTHPAEFASSKAPIEILKVHEGEVSPKLDILWMIDNSGSMCQEQKLLRESLGEFIDILAEIDLDFHIGITTTHYVTPDVPVGEYEPVALPGRLQLTPQPVPGFDKSCYYKVNPDGTLDHDADLIPIVDAIHAAVECTEDPSKYEHLKTPNMDDLRCTFDPARWRATLNCPDTKETVIPMEAYFPDPDDYIKVGKEGRNFLRAEDYRNEDRSLRTDELRRDFSCASMVGTRGYGYEQGLAAIRDAVSVELTGGPDGEPGQFPNAGFLRPDSRTGIIVVSDENDCSHDGTLSEVDSCGSSMCEMSENLVPSPLLDIQTLKDELMVNLTNSKGVSQPIVNDDVIVASIHGPYMPYPLTGPSPEFFDPESENGVNQCLTGWDIPHSCASTKGIAFSGHRYDRFMRTFTKIFPEKPADPNQHIPGLICDDFGSALEDIANLFRSESGGCVTDIYRCDGADAYCPTFAYSGEEGTCTAYPQGDQGFYCDSGVQVRLSVDSPDAATRLEQTGYCEPGSIDQPEYPNGCVVNRANYRWDACPGDGKGVILEWEDPQAHNVLSGLVTQIRYAMLPTDDE